MKRMRILVADDAAKCESLYTKTLKPLERFDFSISSDTADAEARLASQSFDLLLAAVHPPQLDGLTLLQVARIVPIPKCRSFFWPMNPRWKRSPPGCGWEPTISWLAAGLKANWPPASAGWWKIADWEPKTNCCAVR